MKKKELIKENWIKFLDEDDLNEEIPNIELARLVFASSKHLGMYGQGKKNKYLAKRLKELSTFLREIEDIDNILIINNANVNCVFDLKNIYLIIEDRYGPNVVLNLNEGYDESYRFNDLFRSKESKIKALYSNAKTSGPFKMASISKVDFHQKAIMINNLTSKKVLRNNILELTDTLNNKLLIDCNLNEIYYNCDKYTIDESLKKEEIFYDGKTKENINKILKL